MKKLRHDDFHEICGLIENIKTMIPDMDVEVRGFHVGDGVMVPDGRVGTITGFAVDVDTRHVSPFARVNGRLYHVSGLTRV